MAILLNSDELLAMRGLPHAAICLYLAIRQAMDMATGMVGVRSLISWRALAESLYIEPGPNRTESGSIHIERVRKIAGVLERSGLVKNCSNSSNRQLIFKCILASHDKSVQNKQHRQQHRPAHSDKPVTARFLDFPRQEQHRQSDIHPSLALYSIEQSSSTTSANDDDDIQSGTSPPPLIFPPRCEDWQQRMQTMLRNIKPADAQLLLDELAGQMRTGRIERPLAYFRKLIENYLKNDFSGELAYGEQQIRARREDERKQRIINNAMQAAAKKDPEIFAGVRAKLVSMGILKK
jgi:hypothetical protein